MSGERGPPRICMECVMAEIIISKTVAEEEIGRLDEKARLMRAAGVERWSDLPEEQRRSNDYWRRRNEEIGDRALATLKAHPRHPKKTTTEQKPSEQKELILEAYDDLKRNARQKRRDRKAEVERKARRRL